MENVSLYAEALKHDILSADEEQQLLRQAQSGDAKAHERLILCNLQLVHSIVMNYVRRTIGITDDDLMADGIIGLCRAIDKFDFSFGTRLSTYATPWIDQMIARSKCFHGSIRIPEHVQLDITTLNRAKDTLRQKNKPITTQALTELTQLPTEKVEYLKHFDTNVMPVLSFDQDISNGENTQRLIEIVPDPKQEDILEQIENKVTLESFLSKLNNEDRFIVEHAYGIPTKMTIGEIAKHIGKSKNTVSIKLNNIMKRLRNMQKASHTHINDEEIETIKSENIISIIGEQIPLFPKQMEKIIEKQKRKRKKTDNTLPQPIQTTLFEDPHCI